MYGYHECVKWYNWSVLIIIHVLLNSQNGGCFNAQNYSAVLGCFYLTLLVRPSFDTGDELSPSGLQKNCMGTSTSVSDSMTGLY
jgi:hypothetical protein